MYRKKQQRNPLDYQIVSISQLSQQVPATLQNVQYKCSIINNILKTTLIQTFTSQSNDEYSETLYLFPIQENVCLESFEARYNQNIIKGTVKSKEEASKEYEDNKNQGNFVSYATIQKSTKDEQVNIKLGNLPPGQQVQIVITFSQQLQSILNKYYVAIIPLQYVEDEISVKLGKNVLTLDLFCTGKITYAKSKGYPAEQIFVDENTTRFNLNQTLLQKNKDFQVIYSYEGMFDPQVILGSSKVYHEDSVKRGLLPVNHSAMVSFIPNFNKELTQEIDDTIRAAILNGDDILSDEFQQKLNQELIDHLNSSRSEYLFLLDRSGSMSGQLIKKAVESLTLFLRSLPNDSYFNVISFGSSFNKLFSSSKKYDSNSLEEAVEEVKSYEADLGGTETYQPLVDIFQNQERIKGYNKQIFLFTDGEVSRPEEVVELIKKNNKFNRVHSIGFGSGADKFLIEQSAIAGKGISKIIDQNSDLSEVIINMLSSSITPTYDDFSINYDHSIFDSTYPTSTNFPCVFKDEIINIHFFFKPLVDISSLSDTQKVIQIEYYDSQLKKKVKKEIRLEVSDCFTCNVELQESVFKLGKQLYLNEKMSDLKSNGSELLQQAIDFQLLTQKTALICVIKTLNDEQKIEFNNIQNNITYSNQIFNQMQNQSNNNARQILSPQKQNRNQCQSNQYPTQNNQSLNSPFQQSQSQQCQLISNNLINSSPNQQVLQTLEQLQQNISQLMDRNEQLCQLNYKCDEISHESKKFNKSSKQGFFEKVKSIFKNLSSSSSQNKLQSSKMHSNGTDTVEQKNFIKNNKQQSQDLFEDNNSKDQCKQQIQVSIDNDDNGAYIPQETNFLKPIDKSLSQQSSFKQNDKKTFVEQKENSSTFSLKLENIINLVDNLGIWAYNEKLIYQCTSKLNSNKISEYQTHFTKNDAFMSLFILCILEIYFLQEKPKWTLIQKKSNIFIKQNLKQGEDFNLLKQQLIEYLSQ